jgi:hypothetical protein
VDLLPAEEFDGAKDTDTDSIHVVCKLARGEEIGTQADMEALASTLCVPLGSSWL